MTAPSGQHQPPRRGVGKKILKRTRHRDLPPDRFLMFVLRSALSVATVIALIYASSHPDPQAIEYLISLGLIAGSLWLTWRATEEEDDE